MSLSSNHCWITLQVSHHQGRKTCVKAESKTNFSRRLGCHEPGLLNVGILKQFDGSTWLTLTPHILRQIYATEHVLTEAASLGNLTAWKRVFKRIWTYQTAPSSSVTIVSPSVDLFVYAMTRTVSSLLYTVFFLSSLRQPVAYLNCGRSFDVIFDWFKR